MGTPLLGDQVCGPSCYYLDERALDRSDRAADAVIGELATLGEDRLTDLISDMISDAICDARVERDDITDGDFVAIEDAARRRLIAIWTAVGARKSSPRCRRSTTWPFPPWCTRRSRRSRGLRCSPLSA